MRKVGQGAARVVADLAAGAGVVVRVAWVAVGPASVDPVDRVLADREVKVGQQRRRETGRKTGEKTLGG